MDTLNLSEFSLEFRELWNRKRFCKRCGGSLRYDALGEYHCISCGKVEMDDYAKVRRFLDENGPSPAKVISTSTGVPMPIITELLAHGKIEIPTNSTEFLHCEMCGAQIKFGRICASCASKQINGMRLSVAKDQVGDLVDKKESPDDSKNKKTDDRNAPRMYTREKRK